MRRFILVLLLCLPLAVLSQKSYPKLNEHSVVKDTAGTIYPYAVWYKLMFTGWYNMIAENPLDKDSHFILYRLKEEEREKTMLGYGKPKESKSFKVGQTIKGFKAEDINGNSYDLSKLKGKIIVLNFWFIKCAPCQTEIPELNKLVEEYKDSSDVVFLGVALDDKPDLEMFLKRIPFNYNIIYNGSTFARQYNISGYPTHAIIDREGKVYFHTLGLALNTVFWLKKSIRELLNSKS